MIFKRLLERQEKDVSDAEKKADAARRANMAKNVDVVLMI